MCRLAAGFRGSNSIADLTLEELLDGLDSAQKLSIQGAGIYDYWHALVSSTAKADELLTRNTDDFSQLAENTRWP